MDRPTFWATLSDVVNVARGHGRTCQCDGCYAVRKGGELVCDGITAVESIKRAGEVVANVANQATGQAIPGAGPEGVKVTVDGKPVEAEFVERG